MLSKKITIAMSAVVAMGVSAASFAGGYDAPQAPAAKNSGFYVTAQGGYGWDSASKKTATGTFPAGSVINTSTKLEKYQGFTGRLAGGYNINQYLAVEGGFAYYPTAKRNENYIVTSKSATVTSVIDQKLTKNYAFDLMAKAIMPIDNFFGYVAGGVAYVHTKYNDANYTTRSASSATSTETSPRWNAGSSKWYVRPKVAVGVGYNINESMAVGVSYSRIFGKGKVNENKFLPNLNATTVDFTYKF